jgi:2-keto-3-deoxy-L-rhamnonate aldolase RhmA
MADVEHIQIDRRRVVHQLGIVFAGKDVTSATHVGSELIHLVEAAVDNGAAGALVPQVADDKVVGFGLREFVKFQINAAHPEALAL